MPLDRALLQWLNSFAHRSWVLDAIVMTMANNQLIKGSILMFFCWAWFRNRSSQNRDRTYLITGLWTPFLAFLVARLAAKALPYRVRPLAVHDLHLHIPYTIDLAAKTFARTWSAFPSDHAACFSALAMTVLLVSRSAGLLAFLYTLVLIDLPRVYLGFHYPSDIVAGTIIGIALAAAASLQSVRDRVAPPLLHLLHDNPGLFYAGLFLVLYALGHVNAIDALIRFTS